MKVFARALFAAVIGVVYLPEPVAAYTYTFINSLDTYVQVRFCGIAHPRCWMFDGKNPSEQSEHVQVDNFGNLRVFHHASWIYEPSWIMPGQIASYIFEDFSIAVCIDLESMLISVGGGPYMAISPQHVDSDYLNRVTEKVSTIGDSVEKLGSAVGDNAEDTKTKIAGKVVGVIGEVLKPITGLYAVSACKSGRFVIGLDENGNLVMQTSDF